MKILKYALIVALAALLGFSPARAQDNAARKEKLYQMLRKKQEDAKRVEAMAVGVTARLDEPYLEDGERQHKLDIYYPAKKDKPLPVLVHLHGGGWSMGDKVHMRTTGMFYAAQGVLFVAPNYRLSPAVVHPAHVEDCAAALAWVLRHAIEMGGDPKRVFLSGHSAGAHLAALLGTNRKYLRKTGFEATALAGVIAVDTASFNLKDDNVEKLVQGFVRQAFGTDGKVLTDASPFYNVGQGVKYPPFLILNTIDREFASLAGKVFCDKLKSVGCDARFVAVKDHGHAEMAEGMYDAADPVGGAILKFIFKPQR
jgi:arylformamidase